VFLSRRKKRKLKALQQPGKVGAGQLKRGRSKKKSSVRWSRPSRPTMKPWRSPTTRSTARARGSGAVAPNHCCRFGRPTRTGECAWTALSRLFSACGLRPLQAVRYQQSKNPGH